LLEPTDPLYAWLDRGMEQARHLKDVLGQIEPNGRDGRQINDRLSHRRRSIKQLL
jgi:hypothetical protein